jgi:DNA-binding protein HU-beta
MSITKAELVQHLANHAEVTKAQAESVLNALVTTIHDKLRAGDELSITDLGKFSVSDKAARIGRNPSTGEEIKIAAKKAPKFSAAKALKDAANTPPAKKSKK